MTRSLNNKPSASMLNLTVVRQPRAPLLTARVGEVCTAFGLDPRPGPLDLVRGLELNVTPGTITLISGPSGSGKSAVLEALARRVPGAVAVHTAAPPADRVLIDAVAPGGDLGEALKVLSACGLSEARLWLRFFDELSEGERFRARLAWCVARLTAAGTAQGALLLCDEFCTALHDRAARAVACTVGKLVRRGGLSAVVAGWREDLVADLRPDCHITLQPPRKPYVHRARRRRAAFSLCRRLTIEPGGKRDYEAFKHLHYRDGEELGFVDKVFVLKQRRDGFPLGIVVYAYPPLELALRNRVLGERFKGQPARVNRELRIIRRLVIHPDVRGCGLGQHLVRQTLPRVQVPFVECLASMGAVNPVFEKAGMQCHGRCDLPKRRRRVIEHLKSIGADPLAPDFVQHVLRRPRVRAVVKQGVADWYRAICSEGPQRLQRQSLKFIAQTFRSLAASRPVYYLWTREAVKSI